MRDEEAKGAPVDLDWGADSWSLTDVFNAFLLPEFQLEKRPRAIVAALNKDLHFEKTKPLAFRVHKKLRDLIKRDNINVSMRMELHPALWLRLLHFIGESADLRFNTMESSYSKWRKSNDNKPLVIERKNLKTGKVRRCVMDVFLLQAIGELNLKSPYKWRKFPGVPLKLERTKMAHQAKPLKRVGKATLDDKVKKIGKEVCRNVADLLATSKEQHILNLSPMRSTVKSKPTKGEVRHYQYQGAALSLAQHLKNIYNSPISKRSDEVVAKAVRLYVKCT